MTSARRLQWAAVSWCRARAVLGTDSQALTTFTNSRRLPWRALWLHPLFKCCKRVRGPKATGVLGVAFCPQPWPHWVCCPPPPGVPKDSRDGDSAALPPHHSCLLAAELGL